MDSVANTQKVTEVTESQKLPYRKRKFKQHVLREARAMRNSRMAYYEQPTLFDYALEDAGMLQGFFSMLDDLKFFDVKEVVEACTYFLAHANCDMKVKDDLCEKLSKLQNFHAGLANFQSLIAEKTYYYSALWDRLEEIAEYRNVRQGT